MSTRLNDLERLQTMLNDEIITPEEFSLLKDELFQETPESAETVEEGSRAPEPSSDPATSSVSNGSEQARKAPTLYKVAFALGKTRKAPTLYKVAFGLGIASVFLGGFLGLLAWATVGISVWALYSLEDPNRRWMAWTGLVLGIVFSFFNAYQNGHLDSLFAEGSPSSQTVQWTPNTSGPSVDPAPPLTQPIPPPTEPPLTWTVGACARDRLNGLLWNLTPCSSDFVDALVIDTQFLSDNCPAETDFYVELSPVRVACLMEKVVRPWTSSP